MNVLGVNGFTDSSAALLSVGEIVHAVEEERLNREKHYTGMPWLSIEECFDNTNTSLEIPYLRNPKIRFPIAGSFQGQSIERWGIRKRL
jgi:predicted NodU family carbamoyl transferase